MTRTDVERIQSFRIQVLMAMYEEAQGFLTFIFPNAFQIPSLLGSERNSEDELLSALMFLCQMGYIKYCDADTDGDSTDILNIQLMAKGVCLVENIFTDGNIEQFNSEFSVRIIKNFIINICNNNDSTVNVSTSKG